METKVGIVMGSDSDYKVLKKACEVLKAFDVSYEVLVASAHRTPEVALEYASSAEKRGLKVIIAGAGAAAHLAGVLAAKTILPIIGVPINAIRRSSSNSCSRWGKKCWTFSNSDACFE